MCLPLEESGERVLEIWEIALKQKNRILNYYFNKKSRDLL